MRKYDFTKTWFDRYVSLWRRAAMSLIPVGKKKSWLELGSHEGNSACRILDNFLENGDELTCVDVWKNSETEARFDANVDGRVNKFKEPHDSFLVRQITENRKYDLIYIDGNHDAKNVLSDSVLSWKILADGGLMIWDDYRWKDSDWSVGQIDPKHAIDGFLRCHSTSSRIVNWGSQVIIQKLPAVS